MIPSSYEFIDIRCIRILKVDDFIMNLNPIRAHHVIILGYEVAKGLFEDSEPLEKQVRLYGRTFTVIGVIEKARSRNVW